MADYKMRACACQGKCRRRVFACASEPGCQPYPRFYAPIAGEQYALPFFGFINIDILTARLCIRIRKQYSRLYRSCFPWGVSCSCNNRKSTICNPERRLRDLRFIRGGCLSKSRSVRACGRDLPDISEGLKSCGGQQCLIYLQYVYRKGCFYALLERQA